MYTWTAAAEIVLTTNHLTEVLKTAQETQMGEQALTQAIWAGARVDSFSIVHEKEDV